MPEFYIGVIKRGVNNFYVTKLTYERYNGINKLYGETEYTIGKHVQLINLNKIKELYDNCIKINTTRQQVDSNIAALWDTDNVIYIGLFDKSIWTTSDIEDFLNNKSNKLKSSGDGYRGGNIEVIYKNKNIKRRTMKRRTMKRRKMKRRSNKRKSNKRRSNKRRTMKIKY